MEPNLTKSVCRLFYEKFSPGQRDHVQLVSFLLNHPSSRKKLEEWILSEEAQHQFQLCSENSNLCSHDNEQRNGNVIPSHDQVRSVSDFDQSGNNFSKCEIRSSKERELGNGYFKKKVLGKSLYHYNQAIKYAPFPTPINEPSVDNDRHCLPLALANRSAVYDEMGTSYYDKALKDVDLALKYRYPERLHRKLLIRKASILTKQGKCQAAQECLGIIKASESLSATTPRTSGDGADEKINKIEMQIKNLMETCPAAAAKTDTYSDEENENFTENRNFESASDCISIRSSEALGRHVIALTDVQEGDILFKELPFASVLLPEFYDSHCHHCHKSLDGETGGTYFFPCSRCTQVVFCDDLCAASAESYHAHECGWLNLMHSVGIAHLAVRIALVAGVENVLDCMKNHSYLSDFTNLEIFKRGQSNYYRVYSLLDHIEDMFEEDLFQYSLTASLLTRFLISKTSFMQNVSEQMQLQVGGALLRHICQLVCNAHAVTDILADLVEPSLVIDEYQKRIATAIFPGASIMNHSCDSNVMFYFVDCNQLIVKGARTIKSGENVYNCYGPHFRRMPRAERQDILMQQYFFTCNCNKCTEELQTGVSFADQFQALKCEECQDPVYLSEASSEKCLTCGRIQNMGIKIELLTTLCELQKKGDQLLKEGRISEATDLFTSCYASASQILFKYNSQFGKICDSLARCLVLRGNFREAKKLLEKSLQYVEVRFGKTSLEYEKESEKCREVVAQCQN